MGCVPSSDVDARGDRRRPSRSDRKRRSRTSNKNQRKSSQRQSAASPPHLNQEAEIENEDASVPADDGEPELLQQPTLAAPTRTADSRGEEIASHGAAEIGSSPARTDGTDSHFNPSLVLEHSPEQPVNPPRASSLASATAMNTRHGSAAPRLLPAQRSTAATGSAHNSGSGTQPPIDPMVGNNTTNTDSGSQRRTSLSLKSAAASDDRRRASHNATLAPATGMQRRTNSVTAAVTLLGSRSGANFDSTTSTMLRDANSRSGIRDPRVERWLAEVIEDTFAGDFSGPDEYMNDYRPEPLPDEEIDQGCSAECYCHFAERRSQSVHHRARSELLVNPLAGFR